MVTATPAGAESSAALSRSTLPLTGEFWAHVDKQELVRPFCSACRRSFFVPQVVCGRCQSENWNYQPSAGRGVVYSYTIVHRAPTPAFKTPYVLAIVDIREEEREGDSTNGEEDGTGAPATPTPAAAPAAVVAPVPPATAPDVWSMLTWIVDCEPSKVRIGMAVKVKFVVGPDGALLPAFAPAEGLRDSKATALTGNPTQRRQGRKPAAAAGTSGTRGTQ